MRTKIVCQNEYNKCERNDDLLDVMFKLTVRVSTSYSQKQQYAHDRLLVCCLRKGRLPADLIFIGSCFWCLK